MNLMNLFQRDFDAADVNMAKRLTESMKPGDLKVRANEAMACALAALRQIGFEKTANAIEEYLTKGARQ